MWFVLDNALVLPEYLVEFEYVTNLKTPPDQKKSSASDQSSGDIINDDCNKLLEAINGAQKVLENTYINYGIRRGDANNVVTNLSIHLTALDLDRSDMGCLKKILLNFMKSCHIEELLNNGF